MTPALFKIRSGTPCEFMTTLAQVLDRVGIRFVDGIELVRAPDGRAEFFNCPRGAAAACDLLPQTRKLIHHRPAQAACNAGDQNKFSAGHARIELHLRAESKLFFRRAHSRGLNFDSCASFSQSARSPSVTCAGTSTRATTIKSPLLATRCGRPRPRTRSF